MKETKKMNDSTEANCSSTWPSIDEIKTNEGNNANSNKIGRGSTGGVTYSWEKLNVYAENKNFWGKKVSEKHILKDVSGLCKSGQLLAIMGASGAGKTTLLNVLTYRSVNLKIVGDIRINGRKADPDTLMGISAYVQQVDLFTRVFTVREQLNFHAQLRIGKNVSESERKKRIEQVIRDLGMIKCADTLIGDPGRIKGISGGEKKRLAFACELITNPLLLLCDEPTSGIDSFMAQSVMNAVKEMTHQGKTVISTIHQPSSEVFAMFDHLLILAEGRVAFLGTVDEAHKFFNRIERPCPENFNPGDHFIHTLAVRGGTEDKDRKYIHKVCDEYSFDAHWHPLRVDTEKQIHPKRMPVGIETVVEINSLLEDNEGRELDKMVEEAKQPPKSNNALSNIRISKNPYRATYADQFAAVLRRSFLEVVREPTVTAVKICQSLFFALVFGLIYFKQDPSELAGIRNISSVLFIFVTNLSFSTIFPVITIFAGEMPLFLREHWNGLYRSDVYFITRNLVEFPIYVLIPIGFGAVNYFMVGLRAGAGHFFTALGIMVMITTTSVSYGYMISCMADNYNTALVLSTPLTFPLMLFGGFYMETDTIPVYLGWMKYLSWFMYGYEALSINQWNNFTITNETNVEIPVGKYALDKFAFQPEDMALDLGAMFALAVLYRSIAYLLLFLKTVRKK